MANLDASDSTEAVAKKRANSRSERLEMVSRRQQIDTPVNLTKVTFALQVAGPSPSWDNSSPLSPNSTSCPHNLGFLLPHARFQTFNPPAAAGLPRNAHTDPYAVALHFMTQYNDPESGGLLSFGDSFFPGSVPTRRAEASPPRSLPTAPCTTRPPPHSPASPHTIIQRSERVSPHSDIHTPPNCANVPSFSPFPDKSTLDPRRSLLAFLASALPENHPELTSVLDNVDEHARKMGLKNVPGTVSEVKVRLVWVQVPSENGVHLELMDQFQVEMEHNSYETTVTASFPHRIEGVVDWASDSPMPLPVATEEGELLPNLGAFVPPGSNFDTVSSAPGLDSGQRLGKGLAGRSLRKDVMQRRKEVFPWGVNDPVEAAQRKAERHGQTGNKSSTPSRTVVRLSKDTEEDSMTEAQSHIDATVRQLFYTSNMVHDLSHRCRFTEAADESRFSNANFMTPPDGQNGRCRVYLRNITPPCLDGDIQAAINSGRLGWGESGGMGEGFGGALSSVQMLVKVYLPLRLPQTSSPPQSVPRLPATGASPPTAKAVSVTTFTLWTSLSTPRPTKPLDKPGYWSIRAIGEEMLWVVQQRLIATYGFSGPQFHDT
ncbi:hypothetical protein PAXINDRAFT_13522 [Paxillus involutus ATCC 200175]|uniref:Extracellular metalloproteinase n=1 Tax=Paxillus involutus ATCC 200175 TaxID=664439 RepID=A0A0C9SVU5_PAXIN|nr:hypothetical protein PAXINDRAFT_13522 [Paxillus involutus ATCC 200175]